MCPAARLASPQAALLATALVLGCGGAARAAAMQDDLASHFATAPDTAPDQQQLVQVTVNGIDAGPLMVKVSNGKITLPPATLKAIGITGRPGESLDLSPESGITAQFSEAQATLSLTVPPSRLASQRFAPAADTAQAHLSPETWGAYVNYDLNLPRVRAGLGSLPHERSRLGCPLVRLRWWRPDRAAHAGT